MSKRNPMLVAAGGITFQVRPGEDFIDFEQPKKAQSEWRKHWFYAMETVTGGETGIAQYSPEPSEPRRLCVRRLPPAQAVVMKDMRARIRNL
jgi:hypothetical protein